MVAAHLAEQLDAVLVGLDGLVVVHFEVVESHLLIGAGPSLVVAMLLGILEHELGLAKGCLRLVREVVRLRHQAPDAVEVFLLPVLFHPGHLSGGFLDEQTVLLQVVEQPHLVAPDAGGILDAPLLLCVFGHLVVDGECCLHAAFLQQLGALHLKVAPLLVVLIVGHGRCGCHQQQACHDPSSHSHAFG